MVSVLGLMVSFYWSVLDFTGLCLISLTPVLGLNDLYLFSLTVLDLTDLYWISLLSVWVSLVSVGSH